MRPRGSGSRSAAQSTPKTTAARPKRRVAPQSGSSSRLLYLTATKLLPPISTAPDERAERQPIGRRLRENDFRLGRCRRYIHDATVLRR